MAVINGTPAADNLVGTAGNDTIKGAAGNDTIDAGTGNDLVIGGLGTDSIQLGDGNDAFQWNQKDWSEHVEGGSGLDRGEIIGVAGVESMGVNVNINGLYIADFTGIGGPIVTLNDVEQLVLRPLGGADYIQVSDTTGTDLQQVTIDLAATVNGVAADAQTDTVSLIGGLGDDTIAATMVGSTISVAGLPVATTVAHVGKTDIVALDGGFGNDSIDASKLPTGKVRAQLYGNNGDDVIYGTDGDDAVEGGAGNDIVFLGGGNDRVAWRALGGQDVIEGYAGTDTLLLGADDGSIDIFALGSRARVFRSDGAMLLDTGGIERIEFHADEFGDFVAVNDLTGTDVKEVSIDLGVGTGGNGQSDFVFLAGSVANNAITTKITAGVVSISGLPTLLTIARADGDRVAIDSGAGDDSINVSAVPTKIIGQFDLFGGTGNDTVRGSVAADNLAGGDNNDLLLWNHGDGSDIITGGAGFDTLRLTGAAVDESILLGSIAGQTRLIHGPDAASLLLQTMERVEIATLGGADIVFVQNLEGLGIAAVAVDLAATAGGKTADTKSDAVAFSGTTGGDNIFLQMAGSKIAVNGLAAAASVDHVGKTDIITVIGGDGHDSISAGAIGAGKAVVQIIGGDGNDAMMGSKGNDSVIGGAGNDYVVLGDGNDTFVCATGDGTDEVHGEGGTDTFRFAGISGLGPITIAADGSGIDFIRSTEGAQANIDGIERIELGGAAGFDDVVVQNLAGTGVKLVAIDFGNSSGAKGDSLPDSTSILGSDGNETVTIALSAGLVSVKGLASQVTIAHAEAIDSLGVNAGGGNDSISAASLGSTLSRVYLQGGTGNDKLTGHLGYNAIGGGDGNDTLAGGGGNDSLEGGAGNDRFDGGAGNDGILGELGNDYLIGGTGNDFLIGGVGNDTITGGTGSDTVYYTDVVDGHDVVLAFDGNPAGGQDVLDLSGLFGNLSVPVADRAARISIVDKGASVEVKVDTDGDLTFDLHVATLKTVDAIAVGQDIFVGT
jgi:Ca2+-binding RTX toxin-like protein